MNTKLLAFFFSTLLLFPAAVSAVTVDIRGSTFQLLTDDDTNIALSAKLGESVTGSYAYEVSPGFDRLFDQTLLSGGSQFTTLFHRYDNFYVKDSSVSAFDWRAPLGGFSIFEDGRNYFVFDLTFAPTAATIDADWEVFNTDPTAPRVFKSHIDTEQVYNQFEILGPADDPATQQHADFLLDYSLVYSVFTHNGFLVADVVTNDTLGPTFYISGTLLPDEPVITPVPLPGSMALMGLGLLGLGLLKRRVH